MKFQQMSQVSLSPTSKRVLRVWPGAPPSPCQFGYHFHGSFQRRTLAYVCMYTLAKTVILLAKNSSNIVASKNKGEALCRTAVTCLTKYSKGWGWVLLKS